MVFLVKFIFGLVCLMAFAITCIVMGLFLPFLAVLEGIQAMIKDGSIS